MAGKTNPGHCDTPAHRQFDFWLGEWDVHEPDGRLAGHNRIVSILEGCALHESWEGTSGLRGTSLNSYDAARGSWHQTWVDSSGTLLQLDGGLQADAMVLEGSGPSPTDPGTTARHRVSWSLADGHPDRVRQEWQTSVDGATWQTVFDGLYVRRRA